VNCIQSALSFISWSVGSSGSARQSRPEAIAVRWPRVILSFAAVILSFAASRFAMVRSGKNDSTAASRSRIPSSAAMAISLSVPDDQQAVNMDLLIRAARSASASLPESNPWDSGVALGQPIVRPSWLARRIAG
jgi:hypothetical protein